MNYNEQWIVYDSEEDRLEEIKRLERRRSRREEIKRKRKRQVMINRILFSSVCLLILASVFSLAIYVIVSAIGSKNTEAQKDVYLGSDDSELNFDEPEVSNIEVEIQQTKPLIKQYEATETENTIITGDDVISEKSILVNTNTNEIIMEKGCRDRIAPASMTKVLTVLVACENITEEELDNKFAITPEITSYSYNHDCSAVGFSNYEEVTVRDLLYGTALKSGGDAALGLAEYVAGSHEEFVNMMNERLEKMGLSGTTHFTNCIGLYDDDHYSTVYDMAMIMRAAADNDIALKILSERKYTTSSTEEHPEGIMISNLFLRRIEDKDTGGDVIAAKTGYVKESGNCAVSYGKDIDGNEYVVCTFHSSSAWKCIYDHVRIYKRFEGNRDNGIPEAVNVNVSDEELNSTSDN